MFHGLLVILGNATVRQFGIGVGIAIALVAGFAVYQHATADPGDHPSEWLTEAEEAELLSAIHSLAGEGQWVAGCLWDGDRKDIVEVVDPPDAPRQFYRAESDTGREMAFVTVPDEPASPSGHSPREQEGSYCLVPAGF